MGRTGTCCERPNVSSKSINFLVPLSRCSSIKWRLKSPQITRTSGHITTFSENWENSSKNSSFRAVFQLLYSCFGRNSNCATNANHCGFCLKVIQSGSKFYVTFVTLFCTQLPFFWTVSLKNCISLCQSQSRNFSCILLSLKYKTGSYILKFNIQDPLWKQ